MKRWLVLLAVALTGCSTAPGKQATGPVLIHLSGIQGETPIDRIFADRVGGGELDAYVEQYRWTADDRRYIGALQAVQQNRAEAQKLADHLTQLRRFDPERRIILTTHSGGCGFAVFALELLPAEVKIDTLVMLAPAVSPEYDLSPALAHVKNSAYVFYSQFDMMVLGAGTQAFGTMDGRRESSAGYLGFAVPRSADPQQYTKLVAIPYQTSWARYANFGDHVGPLMPGFGEHVVRPLLDTGMLVQ